MVSGSGDYYSQQPDGLWVYSSEVNNGVPFKFFESFHAFGSGHTVSFTTQDSGDVVNHTVGMTFGYPQAYTTSLGTFDAVPVEMVETFVVNNTEHTSKKVVWFAPLIGQVGIDEYEKPSDTSPAYQEKIIERSGTPQLPPTIAPTPSYEVLSSFNSSSIPVGNHFEATYFLIPSNVTSITGVTVESVTPATSYQPWAGLDSASNEYMFSVTPDNSGYYTCIVNVTTADGQTHRITHYFTAM